MSNDLQLAQKVIKEYAEHPYPFLEDVEGCECGGEGHYHTSMSVDGCVENLEIPKEKCEALVNDLVYGKGGEIAKVFSKEFADEIAGKALKARVKWLGDHVATEWLRDDYDDGVRADMLRELGSAGLSAKATYPSVLEVANDSNQGLREIAVLALSTIGAPVDKALPFLMKGLESTDVNVRIAAANAIGSYGTEAAEAVPALANLMKEFGQKQSDKFWRPRGVYISVANALVKIGKASIPTLIPIAEADPSPDTRFYAATALASLMPGGGAMLNKSLSMGQENYQLDAIRAICPNITPELLSIARSRYKYDDKIRAGATAALSRFARENPEIVKTLVELTGDDSESVRSAAIESLKHAPQTWEALFALTDRLNDPSPDIRIRAVDAIRYFGPSAWHATSAVAAFLNDPKFDNKRFMLDTLGEIGSAGAPMSSSQVSALLFSNNTNLAVEALWTLRRIGPAAVFCQDLQSSQSAALVKIEIDHKAETDSFRQRGCAGGCKN